MSSHDPSPTNAPVPPATFEGRPLHDPEEPVTDQGLAFDVETLLTRRRALGLFGGVLGSAFLAACGAGTAASTAASSATTSAGATSAATDAAACGDPIPVETAGPYPGDGSNGPDVLDLDGIVRRDLTSSFGGASGTAEGIPLEVELRLLDGDDGCAPFEGAAVYLWHCDRAGRYSLYSDGVTDQNWLRGVQAADADGMVRFTTVFPGCYPGRWPHLHFEVFPGLDAITDGSATITTSQLAFPQDTCETAYATEGYEDSVGNLAQLSLATDNVFGDDGGVDQLATATGTASDGFTIALAVVVSSDG